MKKSVVISDSFKGALSSTQITQAAAETIHNHFPSCNVVGLPVADGGEGTVDYFVDYFLEAIGGQYQEYFLMGFLVEAFARMMI